MKTTSLAGQILLLPALVMSFLFSLLTLSAQDIMDTPASTNSTFVNALVDGTLQTTVSTFLLGFNWGADPSVNLKHAFRTNAMHLNRLGWEMPNPARRYQGELLLTGMDFFESTNKSLDNRFVGMGMYYEPGAVTSGTVMVASPLYPDGCSFGFRTMDTRGTVTSNTLHPTYSSYELKTTNFASVTNALVLANPWPDQQLSKQLHESLPDNAHSLVSQVIFVDEYLP